MPGICRGQRILSGSNSGNSTARLMASEENFRWSLPGALVFLAATGGAVIMASRTENRELPIPWIAIYGVVVGVAAWRVTRPPRGAPFLATLGLALGAMGPSLLVSGWWPSRAGVAVTTAFSVLALLDVWVTFSERRSRPGEKPVPESRPAPAPKS
jgi:hypothetical protein